MDLDSSLPEGAL